MSPEELLAAIDEGKAELAHWSYVRRGRSGGVARQELADHKLHVAENYVTKVGMAEQTAQIMKAIDGVSGKLDHLTGRIDGLMKPSTRTRAQ